MLLAGAAVLLARRACARGRTRTRTCTRGSEPGAVAAVEVRGMMAGSPSAHRLR
ncbi:hypothetical protein [Massilia sp. 9096]|uniref:hypothetical protein n=1 Tax=Massilia sp. 9096 TaxID=1500894 RepID=UPI0035A623C3